MSNIQYLGILTEKHIIVEMQLIHLTVDTYTGRRKNVFRLNMNERICYLHYVSSLPELYV